MATTPSPVAPKPKSPPADISPAALLAQQIAQSEGLPSSASTQKTRHASLIVGVIILVAVVAVAIASMALINHHSAVTPKTQTIGPPN